MLYIYDSVLEQIQDHIGNHQPERGGALLGEPGKDVVTSFIFDSTAFTTSSTYSPSRILNQKVRIAEEKEGLEYKGIIHSHPGSLNRPSRQDISELETGLRLNSHMPYYLVPIVTRGYRRDSAKKTNELVSDDMKVTFYAGHRREKESVNPSFPFLYQMHGKNVDLKEMEVTVIPENRYRQDLETVCESIIGLKNPQVFTVDHDSKPMLAGSIEVEGLLDLLILVDTSYPTSTPSLLVTYKDEKQVEYSPKWSDEASFTSQLMDYISKLIEESDPKEIDVLISQEDSPTQDTNLGFQLLEEKRSETSVNFEQVVSEDTNSSQSMEKHTSPTITIKAQKEI